MKYSEEFVERLYKKAHNDLITEGKRYSRYQWLATGGEPTANEENAEINGILKKDPYAADREKTQMKRDENNELAVKPIS